MRFVKPPLISALRSTINTDTVPQMSWRKIWSISGFILIAIYAVTSRRLQECVKIGHRSCDKTPFYSIPLKIPPELENLIWVVGSHIIHEYNPYNEYTLCTVLRYPLHNRKIGWQSDAYILLCKFRWHANIHTYNILLIA